MPDWSSLATVLIGTCSKRSEGRIALKISRKSQWDEEWESLQLCLLSSQLLGWVNFQDFKVMENPVKTIRHPYLIFVCFEFLLPRNKYMGFCPECPPWGSLSFLVKFTFPVQEGPVQGLAPCVDAHSSLVTVSVSIFLSYTLPSSSRQICKVYNYVLWSYFITSI